MRKRKTVIIANPNPEVIARNNPWWQEFKFRPDEDVPPPMVKMKKGEANQTEPLEESEAVSVLEWCASLQGWKAANPKLDVMVTPEQRPLVVETVTEHKAATKSGAYFVYHLDQAEEPLGHNARRGKFFFEPKDWGFDKPYSPGFDTEERALDAAEAHEQEQARRRERSPEGDEEHALRETPRPPAASSRCAGRARAARVSLAVGERTWRPKRKNRRNGKRSPPNCRG